MGHSFFCFLPFPAPVCWRLQEGRLLPAGNVYPVAACGLARPIASESSNIRRKMLVVLSTCWASVASVWVLSVRRR
ncbi:hypothetical protein ACLK17_27210 [Escherichia coli]